MVRIVGLAMVVLLLALAVPAGAQDRKPVKKELFAAEAWYKERTEPEQAFVGVLRFIKKDGGIIGIGRFNPYYLEMEEKGKKSRREVYVGGKPKLLEAFIGKKVRFTGKPVDIEVVGKVHKEIWPARVEVVEDRKD